MYVRGRIRIFSKYKELSEICLVDTGTSWIIADESVIKELKLKTFGEARIATLGIVIECKYADVGNVIIEDFELGPRRIIVCKFPDEVKRRLKSMGFSERIIIGISEIEAAGYFPNTAKGILEKVGHIAL
jgi:predicted aspartyl protease